MADFSAIASVLKTLPESREAADVSLLYEATKNVTFLKKLGPAAHTLCCRWMMLEVRNAGEFAYKKNDPALSMYIILRGEVYLLNDKQTKKITKNIGSSIDKGDLIHKQQYDYFGELALMDDNPRKTSAFCKVDSVFAILERNNYQIVFENHVKKIENDLLDYLSKISIFKKFRKNTLINIMTLFECQNYAKNNIIFHEGHTPHHFFIIKNGEVRLTKKIELAGVDGRAESGLYSLDLPVKQSNANAEINIVQLSQGDLVGVEELYYYSKKRKYSAVCVSPNVEILAFSKENFDMKLRDDVYCEFLLKKISEEKKSIIEERIEKITQTYNKNSSLLAQIPTNKINFEEFKIDNPTSAVINIDKLNKHANNFVEDRLSTRNSRKNSLKSIKSKHPKIDFSAELNRPVKINPICQGNKVMRGVMNKLQNSNIYYDQSSIDISFQSSIEYNSNPINNRITSKETELKNKYREMPEDLSSRYPKKIIAKIKLKKLEKKKKKRNF